MCECEAGCQPGWEPNRLAPEPPWSNGWGRLGALPAGLGGSSLERDWVSGFLFFTRRKEDEGWWAPREIGSDPVETSF